MPKASPQILPTATSTGPILTTRGRPARFVLLRADARTAVYPTADISDPYVRRVLGAGGFTRYERAHLTALTATFAPKFPALPTDAVRVVVAFCFQVGYY